MAYPALEGNYWDWEFVYRPEFDLNLPEKWLNLESFAPLFRRPRVRPAGRFTYYNADGYPVELSPNDMIDGFTLPFSAQAITLFQINMVMVEILWVAAVHDKACSAQLQDYKWRAALFKECVWFATKRLQTPKPAGFVDRLKWRLRKATRKTRATLLSVGVKLGSIFGAC